MPQIEHRHAVLFASPPPSTPALHLRHDRGAQLTFCNGLPTRPGDAQPTASPTAAAANAAAASFAALTENLSYLDAASIEQVRQAYRFADEAHLGQLRNSGEPPSPTPLPWRRNAPPGSWMHRP